MSDMKLRSSTGGKKLEQLGESSRRQKSPVRPRTKPYDPNRPPVAWNTKPYPGQAENEGWGKPKSTDRQVDTQLDSEEGTVRAESSNSPALPALPDDYVPVFVPPCGPVTDIEGYDANNDPAYATSEGEPDGESHEQEAVFLNLRPQPPTSTTHPVITFGDLKPSIQLEIADNYVDQLKVKIGADFENPVDGCWYVAMAKLGVSDDEYEKLMRYLKRRNKALEMEDAILLTHRKKERQVLAELDDGVPDHIVKKAHSKVKKKTRQKLKRARDKNNDAEVMMATTSEVQRAYQFLDRLDLDRSLAGTWSNGMNTVFSGEYDLVPEPEKFEWKEDLSKQSDPLAASNNPEPIFTGNDPINPFAIETVGNTGTASPAAPPTIASSSNPVLSHPIDSRRNMPWWYTEYAGPHGNVTDAQSHYQWQLTQAELEVARIEKAIFEAELEEAQNEARGQAFGSDEEADETTS